MKQIGEQIKALRKQNGMTQEELADLLGVSNQSVSKWENHLTAPDTSLLPALAGVFRVSIDTLSDYDLHKTEEEIMEICRASWKGRDENPLASRAILDEGLRRFPGNVVLLNNYLYTFNREKDMDEIIRIATGIVDNTRGEEEEDCRLDPLTFLAEAYAKKGEYHFAKATLERIPELYFTKLSVAAQVLQGEDKFKAARAQRSVCLEMLVDMLHELAVYYDSEGQLDKAQAERERGRALIGLFADIGDWVEELYSKV